MPNRRRAFVPGGCWFFTVFPEGWVGNVSAADSFGERV
jgi:hypothetical protein